MNTVIVVVATYAIYAVALGLIATWVLADRAARIQLIVASVVAFAAVLLAISLVGSAWVDPRPFVVDGQTPLIAHGADNGFPSDHMAVATTAAVLVLWMRRRLGVVLLVVAVAIGAARVAAGVHHVPDIVGGLVVGVLCATVGMLVAQQVSAATERRRASAGGQ